MKIIFKTETETLFEVDLPETPSKQSKLIDKMMSEHDDRHIKKYELVFNEGVSVKDCHYLDDIDSKMVNTIVLTVE